MADRIAFYLRNKPQNCDAINISRKTNRGFIGYPMWLKGHGPNDYPSLGYKNLLFDPNAPEEVWKNDWKKVKGKWRSSYTFNRNLIHDAVPGSIAIIPRPDMGLAFMGRVEQFELVDRPDWANEYLKERESLDLPTSPATYYIADVVQSWIVDAWRPIRMPLIPTWIRKSFFGQRSAGRINGVPELSLDPVEILEELINSSRPVALNPTEDVEEVERRLLSWVSPSVFEHLVVGLLQLEEPTLRWEHVGGSGDGGIDGWASDREGNVVSYLQCKWKNDGSSLGIEQCSASDGAVYLATLIGPKIDQLETGIRHLDRRWVAEKLIAHKNTPWANSLGVAGCRF